MFSLNCGNISTSDKSERGDISRSNTRALQQFVSDNGAYLETIPNLLKLKNKGNLIDTLGQPLSLWGSPQRMFEVKRPNSPVVVTNIPDLVHVVSL